MATPAKSAAASAKKERRKIDPNEDKATKFRRLASQRMTMALKSIGSIANLSGNGYSYTKEQADKIVRDLSARVEHVKKSFDNGGTGRTSGGYAI